MKLVIAEKPSVALEISKVIGASEKKNGYYEGNNYLVTWCVGHLVENAMPEDYSVEYKKWNLETLCHLTGKISTEGDGQHARFIGVAALCDGGDVYARDHNVLLPAQIAQVQANLFAIQHGAQHIAQRDILGIARRVWLGNRGGGSTNGNPLLCIHRSYERLLSANV